MPWVPASGDRCRVSHHPKWQEHIQDQRIAAHRPSVSDIENRTSILTTGGVGRGTPPRASRETADGPIEGRRVRGGMRGSHQECEALEVVAALSDLLHAAGPAA